MDILIFYILWGILWGIYSGFLGGLFAWSMKFPDKSQTEIVSMMMSYIVSKEDKQ